MTTQAKNHFLAIVVLMMLSVIGFGMFTKPEKTETEVFIPSDTPITVSFPSKATTVSKVDTSEFECLRLNIYHESGNQSRRGMEAVALVTINRTKTKHYPSTICGVVKQAVVKNGVVVRNKCQFSWHCDGKPDKPNLHNVLEAEAWERATVVAKAAMNGKVKDFLGRATHYHATYSNPDFANVPSRYKRVATVGIHIFYRDIKLGLKS